MNRRGTRQLCLLTVMSLPLCATARGEGIDFGRDVRPILSDYCWTCHGADEANRQADLRLDLRGGLFADRETRRIVAAGSAERSELLRRITAADDEQRMPPPETGRKLSLRQIDLIRRWIDEGAKWQPHWAFTTPQRPPLPYAERPGRLRNGIDPFIVARLEREGLGPAPPADQARLIRRVTLDLTGLPPSIEEVDRFLADDSPDAYEKVVDRLLSSPRYGERMAQEWLDLARYADTDGYQDDEPRVMWRWREWVIDVLNDNLAFDQFTIEQLAGDLLPDAEPDQVLATGFLRNNRTNGEGGSIAEEFRVEYVVDRIDTIATVWLGMTLACARCHDHKYDPITQHDFYRVFAYFNNVPEKGTYRRNSPPLITVPSRVVQLRIDQIDRRLARPGEAPGERDALQSKRERLLNSVPTTMVMQEGPPRETFILTRGQYDKPGEKVVAGLPEFLAERIAEPAGATLDGNGHRPVVAPSDRLDLARWLTGSANPVTARVTVNRLWRAHFGTGLVKTAEDFGAQGDPPSHPQLLDWLATELVRRDWDVKAMHRLIVTSATYRQSSRVTARHEERDPENRLLARAPRLRLSAETIRDQAAAIGGLLVERIGGPSVKPPQPAGLWKEIAGGASGAYEKGYEPDRGASRYRRSIYTFWRRTIPPPSMTTFDAPGRETCTARRARTNTPLQALALLNEVTYVDAARGLARRMLRDGGSQPQERLAHGFRLALAREPSVEELNLLLASLQRYRELYRHDGKAARALITAGDWPSVDQADVFETAAYTAMANVLLNLDETITAE